MRKTITTILFISFISIGLSAQFQQTHSDTSYYVIQKNFYLGELVFKYDFNGLTKMYETITEDYIDISQYLKPSFDQMQAKRQQANTIETVSVIAGGTAVVGGILLAIIGGSSYNPSIDQSFSQFGSNMEMQSKFIGGGIGIIAGGLLIGTAGFAISEFIIAPNEGDYLDFANKFNKKSDDVEIIIR